ncbi:hypothetical protein CQ012_12910 [Arthrobacter sp. MYb214]|uniref:siderophore-interacting protein n=1 Tax=unclassified Arthrobacter TaxID=235627 RepID=UPI000CFB86F3|nr:MULTISPECIES: siderophore-interacting protein [unclassified Arthrobacter]PQZ86828.1 hypothetical protein CQ016_10245 [Arthrobacter sp. MYb222]PRB74552.1 hypothetical protein CQ012_12910 [Arthrobacter sp. MYb214]
MSKHHKYKSYGPQYTVTPREGLTLEILAQAEKAGAKAGYAMAKEQLYRNIGNSSVLNEQETDELLAAAERAGAAAALTAARKVLDKTLRTSFKHYHHSTAQGPAQQLAPQPFAPAQTRSYSETYEEPLAQHTPALGYLDPSREKVDQHILTITRVEQLNDQMVRIIAGAPDLDGYRSNGAIDEYVKVFAADPALGLEPPYDLRALRQRLPRDQVPRSKSYTIRWINAVVPEIAIDFVVHGEPGTVGHWAGTAQPGDPLVISPSRSKSSLSLNADYYVLAADEAGIPAICKALEALPSDARGLALLEVADQNAMFDVKHPPGVDLRWLPRDGVPAGRSSLLADELRSLPLPPLRLGLIAHAERSTVKEISQVARHWHLDKRSSHISSYWTLREGRLRR